MLIRPTVEPNPPLPELICEEPRPRHASWISRLAGTLPLSAATYRLISFGGFWRQIAQGTAWTAIGTVVAQFSSFFVGILIARLLGKDSYGKFGLLQTTVAVSSLFTGFGLSLTATRYLSQYRFSHRKEAGRLIGATGTISLTLAGSLSVLFFFFAGTISRSLSGRDDLTGLLRICAVPLFAASLLSVQQGVLTGFESFRAASLMNVARGVSLVPLVIIGTYAASLSGALWAIGAASLAGCILGAWFIVTECRRHGIRPEWSVRWSDLIMIRDCALPTFLTGVTVTPVNWLVSALIVRSPGGYPELAILTAGVYFRTALLFFQGVTGTVLLPIFSSHSRAKRDQVLWSATAMNVVVGLAGLAAASVAPDFLMRVFGKTFQGHGGVVIANVASGALMLAYAPVAYYLTGAGYQWLIMISNAIWALFYFSGSVFSIRWGWGALGVAQSCACAYVLQLVFCFAVFAYIRKVRVEP